MKSDEMNEREKNTPVKTVSFSENIQVSPLRKRKVSLRVTLILKLLSSMSS